MLERLRWCELRWEWSSHVEARANTTTCSAAKRNPFLCIDSNTHMDTHINILPTHSKSPFFLEILWLWGRELRSVVASYVPVFLILLQSYITTSLHQLFFKNLRNILQLLCYFSTSIFQKFEIPSRYITTSLHCYINFPKICGLVL